MFRYQHDRPEIHLLMKELRQLIDGYDQRVLIGETDDIQFYGNGSDELHLVFNFPLMRTAAITGEWVRKNQTERLDALPAEAWPCNTLGNHDSPRMYGQFGDGENDARIALANLAMLLTLKGTPFLYNGEEIGMVDYLDFTPEQFRDPIALRTYRLEQELLHTGPAEAAFHASKDARDKCRTPMQWSNEPNGGFSPAGVETWLPVNPNYAAGVNVADETADEGSLLNAYQRLITLRKSTPALIDGDYRPVGDEKSPILAFLRNNLTQACLVSVNMSAQPAGLDLGFSPTWQGLIYSNKDGAKGPLEKEIHLAPFEIRIDRLDPRCLS